MRSSRLAIWLVAAAVVGVYAVSVRGPFVLDDFGAITNNPTIRRLSDLPAVLSPPHQGQTVSGRPVLNLSFALNYAAEGTSVIGYHLVNIAIAVAGALALLGIARRTLGDPAALALTLLWSLHPLLTESVSYASQRAESLMGLFYLLTLYCFIRAVGGNRTWPVLAVLVCALGMAAKEVMVSAPVIVLCYDRTFLSGSFRQAWRLRWKIHLCLFSTWIILAALAVANGSRGGTAGFGTGVPPTTYWLTQWGAVARYVRLAFWPVPLIFDYGPQALSAPEILVGALLTLILAAATVVSFAAGRKFGFAGLWFFAILAPTSLVPGGRQMLAEHRMYLALIPVVACVVVAFARALKLLPLIAIAAALGALTIARNRLYDHPLLLWEQTVAARPGNPYAQNNLGHELAKSGRPAEAIPHFETAIRLKPDLAEAHAYLGAAFARTNQLPRAIAEGQEAVRLAPGFALAHTNLGAALAISGRLPEAIAEDRTAIQLEPDLPEGHFNLGDAYLSAADPTRAAAEFALAARLAPGDASLYNNWGYALTAAGHPGEAVPKCLEALRLRPDYAEARFNLGIAEFNSGAVPAAISAYRQALHLRPNDAEIHYYLGVALAQIGRLAEASAQCEEALRLQPSFPAAATYLGRLRQARRVERMVPMR